MMMYDSTIPEFTPWWTRCTLAKFDEQLYRYKFALRFCIGRAKDLRPKLQQYIGWLENYRGEVVKREHKL